MHRRHWACVFAVVAIVLAGCDSEDEVPAEGPAKAQVVDVVDSYFETVLAGDGETACGYLTEQARQILVKVLRGETDSRSPGYRQFNPDDCPAAVDDPSVKYDGLKVPVVRSSQVEIAEDAQSARVSEAGPTGNEMALARVDDQWLIAVPIFTGR